MIESLTERFMIKKSVGLKFYSIQLDGRTCAEGSTVLQYPTHFPNTLQPRTRSNFVILQWILYWMHPQSQSQLTGVRIFPGGCADATNNFQQRTDIFSSGSGCESERPGLVCRRSNSAPHRPPDDRWLDLYEHVKSTPEPWPGTKISALNGYSRVVPAEIDANKTKQHTPSPRPSDRRPPRRSGCAIYVSKDNEPRDIYVGKSTNADGQEEEEAPALP